MNALTDWENFYVIVGSSAGALIGLQFVVITLIADMPFNTNVIEASGAFTTPSVIHFSVVLFLSAIVSIPWEGITPLATIWGLAGLCGISYALIVVRRLRRQTVYEPVFEDWLFHALLPVAAYLAIAAAACIAHAHERCALFGVGIAVLVLLFVGIHNAWDVVTHMVFVAKRAEPEKSEEKK